MKIRGQTLSQGLPGSEVNFRAASQLGSDPIRGFRSGEEWKIIYENALGWEKPLSLHSLDQSRDALTAGF